MNDSPTPAPANRNRKPVGRPSKFTPDTRQRLVELIAKGLPFRHACAAVGIVFQSFCQYRNDHPDFAEEIEQAVSLAMEKRLAVIEKAADLGDVTAARWLLEHLHPQYFARSRIEITGGDGAPLSVGVGVYLPQKQKLNDDAVIETAVLPEESNGES